LDSGDDIVAEGSLRIGSGGCLDGRVAREVMQLGGEGGGTDVCCNAIVVSCPKSVIPAKAGI
jgi:hypothetical protein